MPTIAVRPAKEFVRLWFVRELQGFGIPEKFFLGEGINNRTHEDTLGQVAGV